jgi:hypothetical protein
MSELENFCAGKPDGNYAHPSDPTRYIACVAETRAYEKVCPPGYTYEEGPDLCVAPDGSTRPAN